MSLIKKGMEESAWLRKPENGKSFTRVRLLVQVLLAIVITAVVVLAIQFYSSVK
ncbi:hypothetical protein [Ferruginibacter sp.]